MDLANRIDHAAKSEDADKLFDDIIRDIQNLDIHNSNSHVLAETLNDAGQYLYKHVNFDLAVKCYTLAIKYNTNFAAPYYNRGTIHYRLGEFKLALTDMQKAVELDPTNAEFLHALEDAKKASL